MDPANNYHKYQLLTEPNTGQSVAIDLPIVPIIALLWKNDISTMGSCQGWNVHEPTHVGHIVFCSANDYQKTLKLYKIIQSSIPDYSVWRWPDLAGEQYQDAELTRKVQLFEQNYQSHTSVRNYDTVQSRTINGRLHFPTPRVFLTIEQPHFKILLERTEQINRGEEINWDNWAPSKENDMSWVQNA